MAGEAAGVAPARAAFADEAAVETYMATGAHRPGRRRARSPQGGGTLAAGRRLLGALIAQDEGLASLFSETIAEGGPGRQAKIVCQSFFEHGLLSKACLRHRAQPHGRQW